MSSATSLSQSFRGCMLLANKLVHVPPKSFTFNKIYARYSDLSLRNVDLAVKQASANVQQDELHFKTLQQLGIETHDKNHTFNLNSDQAVRFIKMGIINKYMATQYCHYIAHLSRTLDSELADHYRSKALELALFLGRSNDSLTQHALFTILGDVCDIGSNNCYHICKFLLSKQDLIDRLTGNSFIKFLMACYKYKLWPLATELIEVVNDKALMSPLFIDQFILGMSESAKEFNSLSCTTERERIKNEVFNHTFKLLDLLSKERIQFITKCQLELEVALQQFGIEFKRNPKIKLHGKCKNCNSNLPIYDQSITQDLNSTLKNLLHKRIEGELLVYAESSDLNKFEEFLSMLINKDGKHIDVVIDGLNVAYKNSTGFVFYRQKFESDLSKTHKHHKPTNQVQVLVNTILRSNLLQNYRKILVIGRSHMLKWPGLKEFFNKNNIHYYFSGDNAKDDLFQLYAATLHPRTILVSNDFLRDHLALLQDGKRLILERWIDTHQAWVYSKNLNIIFPTPYEKIPSVNEPEGIFHIPVIDFSKLSTLADHEPPPHLNEKMITWICGKMSATIGNESNE